MRHSPFDHRPWRDLGRVLREVLEVGDDRVFVARVMAEIRALDVRPFRSDWWEVLGAWARPGLAAAAAVVALTIGLAISSRTTGAVEGTTADDALQASTETSVLTVAANPPDVGFILATFPER
jgi:hypothetical protein